MVTKVTGEDVRKLGSKLPTALINPRLAWQKNKKDKVNFEERLVDSPSSPCVFSPMSPHAIGHLRDCEFKDMEDNQEVTAKQVRGQ
jgi:hypothetical protein